jgi:Cu-Zn family superoxide dismutase
MLAPALFSMISLFLVVPSTLAETPGEGLEISFVGANGEDFGKATLREHKGGVKIALDLKGLPPGKHGFHFHEKGLCEKPSFESAGAHYNPDAKEHGRKARNGPHAGDMKDLNVKKDGTYRKEITNPHVTLAEGPRSLLKEGGTALVIHAKSDDQKTQPSGDSGERIACAVVRKP